MGRAPRVGINRQRLPVLALVAVLGLSACGGSSSHTASTRSTSAPTSSPERTNLLAQLRANMESTQSTVAGVSDLEDCIVQQAGELPLPQLRAVASPQVASSVTDPLVAHCVASGKGASVVRHAIAEVVAGRLPAPVPANFTNCILSGVHTLSATQVARAINSSASADQAYARDVGERLALACIRRPAVFASWRRVWIGGVRHSLQQGRQLTPAFRRCVLQKAAHITPDELIKLVRGGPPAQTGYGRHLGELCHDAR